MKVGKHVETELIIDKLNLLKRDGLLPSKKIERVKEGALLKILGLVSGDSFQDIIGYFANHRPNSEFASIDNEYKVQDILYCLLKPIVPDLQYEDPQPKNPGALSHTRVDLISKGEKIFIEAKYADSKHGAKKIEAEISEDIVKYGKSGAFKYLIFFIYCSNYSFPNAVDFANGFTGLVRIKDFDVETYCIIKP